MGKVCLTSPSTTRLRRWSPSDRALFAAMNSDPRVTEYLSGPLSREERDALVERIAAHFDRHGFGLWAVEICDRTPFTGFVGLSVPQFTAHFTPCVEIGWRLGAGSHRGAGFFGCVLRPGLNSRPTGLAVAAAPFPPASCASAPGVARRAAYCRRCRGAPGQSGPARCWPCR